MSAARRDVRPTRDFYLALERQLQAERGPQGQPSRADFQFHELIPIFDRFGRGWDDLPMVVPGRDDYRVLVVHGVLVRALSVIGQLAPDGAVELVDLDIDSTWSSDVDDEPDPEIG